MISNKNTKYLKLMIGLKFKALIQEQYYFEGKLDGESMGTLKVELSNDDAFTFSCNGDAESLSIKAGGFTSKGKLSIENDHYKWLEKDFLNASELSILGKVTDIHLEYTNDSIESGCKIDFESKDYLYIWTIESDNIFYGLNVCPPYHTQKELKIDLQNI